MKNHLRMTFTVVVLLASGLPAISQGQTIDLTKTPVDTRPKVTLLWLGSLTVAPTTVAAGSSVTGTVTLLRPAVSNLTVAISIDGATAIEGNIYIADGAISPGSVTVPAGSDKATFTITTSKPKSTAGSKTFKVNGAYGTERVSASFTTTQLTLHKP